MHTLVKTDRNVKPRKLQGNTLEWEKATLSKGDIYLQKQVVPKHTAIQSCSKKILPI